ncbi:MAG: hypothetical protein RR146_03815 [Lachnospiraceae bacterium]
MMRKIEIIFCCLLFTIIVTSCSVVKISTQTGMPTAEETGLKVEEKIAQVNSITEPEISDAQIQNMEVPHNVQGALSVPTDVKYIDGLYFIVDCYHNQVIYSENLQVPLTEWYVMTDKMNRGHTIVSDGSVYLIDDTENHRILVYQKKADKFIHTQTLTSVGTRPHYMIYDDASEAFYVLSSMTGELYVLKTADDDSVSVVDVKEIPLMQDTYCRSFTIDGDKAYFPATNGLIVQTSFPALEVTHTYPVPDEIAGLVQVYPIGKYYYLTVSTDKEGNQDAATIIRTTDLTQLQAGDYEDIYDELESVRETPGTPYAISTFQNHYYLVEHGHGHGVFQFDIQANQIAQVQIVQ